jgi:small subunit ribosomal protein S17
MADEAEETTEVTAATEAEPAAPEVAVAEAPAAESAPADAPVAPVTKTAASVAPVTKAAAPVAAPAAADDGKRPNPRKVREGVVVSDAMQSTVVVAVVERVRHPRYGKTVQRTKRLYVHDAEDTAKVGDRVRVQETRPLSKLKRWRLTEVVERAR